MPGSRGNSRLACVRIVLALVLLLTFGLQPSTGSAEDPVPPPDAARVRPVQPTTSPAAPAAPVPSSAPGFCPATGGSTRYEYVQSATLTPDPTGTTMTLRVTVYIANPTGCAPGGSCPEYDSYPESVNAWIDWGGDNAWQPADRVMDDSLWGYSNISYHGPMIATSVVTKPASATAGNPWMRVSLGWGTDPNDPCQASWPWGNAVDQQVAISTPTTGPITAEGVGTYQNVPETGSDVLLTSTANVPAGYQVTACAWTAADPGTSLGAGTTALSGNVCTYRYKPSTGPGPAPATYGNKQVKLTITYQNATGASGQTTSPVASYRVFFKKGPPPASWPPPSGWAWPDDNGDGVPNWFEYWLDDGALAVPGVPASDVDYAPQSATYGNYASDVNRIYLGKRAGANRPGLIVPASSTVPCPGLTLTEVQGIDTAVAKLAHFFREKVVYLQGQVGALWNPNPAFRINAGGPTVQDGTGTTWTTDNPPPPNVQVSGGGTHSTTHDIYNAQGSVINAPQYQTERNGVPGDFYYDFWVEPGKTYEVTLKFAEIYWDNPGQRVFNVYVQGAPALSSFDIRAHVPKWTEYTADPIVATAGADGKLRVLFSSIPNEDFAKVSAIEVKRLWRDSDGDGRPILPDEYETRPPATNLGTSPNNRDSCNLASAFPGEPYLLTVGDSEFDALKTENDASGNPLRGVAANDWANPGKQTTTPYTPYSPVAQAPQAGGASTQTSGSFRSSETLAVQAAPNHDDIGMLTGVYTDSGVDADGDGLFDSLKLSAGLDIGRQGDYNLVAWLIDGTGDQIAWAASQSSITPGKQTLDLLFDGKTIRARGLDGPYTVARVELRVGDEDFLVAAADNAYTTQTAYTAAGFDPAAVTITGVTAAEGVDTNDNTLFDWLRMQVGLSVDVAGSYAVVGELAGTRDIAVASAAVPTGIGQQSVTLDFSGPAVFRSRQDGPYHLTKLRVVDASGSTIALLLDAYTTQAHSHDQFEHKGTVLPSQYEDTTVDFDGNGVLDYLLVNSTIGVAQAGRYRVLATLVDGAGATILSKAVDRDLSAGPNALSLEFPGGAISTHGVNGPYVLTSVTLLDAAGEIVDYQQIAHTTSAYTAASFANPPVTLTGSYQDRTVDANSNGLADFLDVDVGVTAGNTGFVVVQARLQDSTGRDIQWAKGSANMTAGQTGVVTLRFDGRLIGSNGLDGPYEVKDLLAFRGGDPDQYVYASHPHSTAAYDAKAFEAFLDRIPPTTTASQTPAPNAAGWNKDNVTVALSAVDAADGTGVKEVHYVIGTDREVVVSGASASFTISAEGTTTVSYWAVDNASNAESPHTLTLKIDKTAPTLDPTVTPNPVLLRGTATASAGATDAGSGIASQSCDAPDTSSVGPKTLTCTATDNAGNTASKTVSYQVIYQWDGFLQPISDTAHQIDGTSMFAPGSTVFARFQLKDASGTAVEAAKLPLWLEPLKCEAVTDGGDVHTCGTSVPTTDTYRWTGKSMQYSYNWSTRGVEPGFYYQIGVRLDDGTTHTVVIGVSR